MKRKTPADGREVGRWLLLVLKLPSRPAYLRVKTWRRLRELGAVVLRNAVHALPENEQSLASLKTLVAEVERKGGEGLICASEIVAGLSAGGARAVFNAARNADYARLADRLRQMMPAGRRRIRDSELRLKIAKARREFAGIGRIDFFGADGRSLVEILLSRLEHSLIEKTEGVRAPLPADRLQLLGKTWVTRRGIHVDRIACAWLVRRFIDAKARLKFVPEGRYRSLPGEIGFDMAGAEITHQDGRCSFEVLLDRIGNRDKDLSAIGEIVHDLDIQDRKFNRPQTAGIGHVIDGICLTQPEDEERLARGMALFDGTYERFRKKPGGRRPGPGNKR
jgi:hypothetical protein